MMLIHNPDRNANPVETTIENPPAQPSNSDKGNHQRTKPTDKNNSLVFEPIPSGLTVSKCARDCDHCATNRQNYQQKCEDVEWVHHCATSLPICAVAGAFGCRYGLAIIRMSCLSILKSSSIAPWLSL